jgi:hypothetical protein
MKSKYCWTSLIVQVKILFEIILEDSDFSLENAFNLVIPTILNWFLFEKDQKTRFLDK